MTSRARTLESEIEAATKEAMTDPDMARELTAGRYPLSLRRLMVERAIAGASAMALNAPGRGAYVERLRAILLHPAAGSHWQEARSLVLDEAVQIRQARRALDALAANPGANLRN